jgi:hypothetical protein
MNDPETPVDHVAHLIWKKLFNLSEASKMAEEEIVKSEKKKYIYVYVK